MRAPYRWRPCRAIPAVLIVISSLPTLVHAQDLTSLISTALRLDEGDSTVFGVCIVELPSGREVYSAGAGTSLKPASNMKLLSSAAALDVLGTEFAFRTECRLQARDLVIVGGGDPLFAYANGSFDEAARAFDVLYAWADQLHAAGMDHIPGDLIIIDSVFDQQWVNPTWPTDQLQHYYCAAVGGLNLHGNCIRATVRPGNQAGAPAEFSLVPSIPWLTVENRCRTGGSGQPWMTRKADGEGFLLAGRCTKSTDLGRVTVHDPGIFFGQALRAYLAAKGIRIEGRVRRGLAADVRQEADTVETPKAIQTTPIIDVLKRANTDSFNLAAEALLKMTGRQHAWIEAQTTTPGSWESGRAAVHAFLQRAGLDSGNVVVADGSGLSHDNRVTPRMMVGLLTHMYRGPNRDVYMNSLARCGLEGTLRKRMRDMPGRFLGKTGYINGVRALSGYMQTDDGTWLAVSLIHNGFKGSSSKYREAQEQVCRILRSYERSNGTP